MMKLCQPWNLLLALKWTLQEDCGPNEICKALILTHCFYTKPSLFNTVMSARRQIFSRGHPETFVWRPLYAFARYRRHSPEDAQDLVQGFFRHLIERRALGTIAQAKGRFRSFLLASFQNFIAMEQRHAGAEKRGGRAELVRIDWQEAEDGLGFEPEDRLTPETLYDARCALELLERATRRLEREHAARGNAQTFRTLRPFLGDEGARADLSYEAAAQALNVGLPALKR